MTFDQLTKHKEDGTFFIEDFIINKVGSYVSIDDKIAFPIITSQCFEKESDISVHYEKGLKIGYIKFLKGYSVDNIRSLPNDKLICFFIDYDKEEIIDSNYTFQNDFLIIEKKFFDTYTKIYKKSSSIWGSYFHVEDKPEIKFDKKKSESSIRGSKGLVITNPLYSDNLYLSITEPNPFNRFLKLYHLLELQFDMHTAEKISELLKLGNQEKLISSKLKEYTKDEIKRLDSIIDERCSDIDRLVKLLNQIKAYKDKAVEIFYEYGRETNPLKRSDFNKVLGNENLFEETSINLLGGYNHRKLIGKLSSYWIYRVRSSIAHNKFGEYIMDKNDEEFIVEFAEPLLKEVVKQCFKV